ncbi:hypothetical protein [Halomarina litorea]|uniref:hypothetical protein n=1 Tax=Halomarina litorea TaxID=2961595 RepID=UPI0020C1FD97|nr:hypothetical protein [Halomarina sp. BCD28]
MNRTVAVLVVALVASMAVVPAGASAATGTDSESDAFEVRDLTVTVSDVQVSGTGLPDWSVDHATYTVEDATVGTDGFTVVWNGEEHHVGAVQVTVDDVGLVLEDVSVSGE